MMMYLRAHVATNILDTLRIVEDNARPARFNSGTDFHSTEFVHNGRRTRGNIEVLLRDNGRFDVSVLPIQNIRPVKHKNLTGQRLEDLLITLADI